MNKEIEIWGRKLSIRIDFDLYPGEVVTDEQNERLESFSNNTSLLSDASEVSDFCIKNNKKEIGNGVDNIFKFVVPTSILIPKSSENKCVILLCNYKFDIEHGLAVVYENNQFAKIVSQDEIL